MAEIPVQRKRSGIWPGILAAFAIVLLAWLVAETWIDDDELVDEAVSAPNQPEIAPTTGASPMPPAEVAAFLTFAANPNAPAAGPAHDYTAGGIRRLSAALEAITRDKHIDGQNVRDRLEAFRQTAQQIQSDREAMGHSDQVRETLMSAGDLMRAMQQDRWADAAEIRKAVEETRTAAGAIEANRPLLEQASEVRQFFDRAATALRARVEQT